MHVIYMWYIPFHDDLCYCSFRTDCTTLNCINRKFTKHWSVYRCTAQRYSYALIQVQSGEKCVLNCLVGHSERMCLLLREAHLTIPTFFLREKNMKQKKKILEMFSSSQNIKTQPSVIRKKNKNPSYTSSI